MKNQLIFKKSGEHTGKCKLPSAEKEACTHPQFNSIHPYTVRGGEVWVGANQTTKICKHHEK